MFLYESKANYEILVRKKLKTSLQKLGVRNNKKTLGQKLEVRSKQKKHLPEQEPTKQI